MAKVQSQSYQKFEAFLAKTGNTYIFDGESSVAGVGILLELIRDMGLDPMKTADLKQGMLYLFNIEIINLPDFDHHRYLLAPNHVSDLDALILGLLHPNIRIVAKSGWATNEKLRRFLDVHYDVCGLDRESIQSLRHLLTDSIEYFNGSDENRHYLVFSQGTISDFNNNSPERVSAITQKISVKTGVPIVPVFLEQANLEHPTRYVFGEPMELTRHDNFSALWLEREAALQNALVPPARRPVLSHKHANNNKPGDLYF